MQIPLNPTKYIYLLFICIYILYIYIWPPSCRFVASVPPFSFYDLDRELQQRQLRQRMARVARVAAGSQGEDRLDQ